MSAGERPAPGPADGERAEGPELDYSRAWQAVEVQRNVAAMFACRQLLEAENYAPGANRDYYLESAAEFAAEARLHDERLERLHERWRAGRRARGLP